MHLTSWRSAEMTTVHGGTYTLHIVNVGAIMNICSATACMLLCSWTVQECTLFWTMTAVPPLIGPISSHLVVLVWDVASDGESMRRMDECFLQTNCFWGIPPPHVEFRDVSVESIHNPLKDVHGVCRIGCVCLDLLCHMGLLSLQYLMCSDVSIFRSLWDDFGLGRAPPSWHLKSRSVV
jgi:hypothetical protein